MEARLVSSTATWRSGSEPCRYMLHYANLLQCQLFCRNRFGVREANGLSGPPRPQGNTIGLRCLRLARPKSSSVTSPVGMAWQSFGENLQLSDSSHVTGWLTVAGWQASMASVVYLSATLVQGLITFTNPSYTAEPWHAVLLCWMVIIFSISINAFVSSFLAKFEGLILVLHILGFFAVMLPLVTLGKHQDKANVFGRFLNEGPMPTQGLSVLVGMVGSVFIFVGRLLALLYFGSALTCKC